MKIAYLGPSGTYSEEAARVFQQNYPKGVLNGLASLEAVAKSLSEEADLGVMVYYNFLEGLVQECLDLIYENDLSIVGAERIPITFSIGHYRDTADATIHSHPKALAQCSDWLMQHFSSSMQIATASTAAAAEKVRADKSGLAIASIDALRKRGLVVVAEDIGNKKYGRANFTDFYLVTKSRIDQEYKPSEKYNTMVAITPHFDRPGLLADILQEIASYGLNNAKIHSRPAIDDICLVDGEPQMFYIEIMAHQNDASFKKGMSSLRKLLESGQKGEVMRVLGSYLRPKQLT